MTETDIPSTLGETKISPQLKRSVWQEAFKRTAMPTEPYEVGEIVAHRSGIAYEVVRQNGDTIDLTYTDEKTGERVNITDDVTNVRPDSIASVYASIMASKIGKATVPLNPDKPYLNLIRKAQLRVVTVLERLKRK